MKKFLLGIALLLIGSLTLPVTANAQQVHPQTFVATDITDIWFNALESGWGLQVNQSDNFAFVTIFIYGPNGTPFWVTAELTYVGNSTYTGSVFLSNGPFYGLPTFNPDLVARTPVGTMTFVLDTVDTAHIVYSINGVAVAKNIQRQPLKLENITGTYTGSANFSATGCTAPSNNGSGNVGLNLTLNQTGSAISGSFQFVGGIVGPVCNFSGSISEAGRMQTIGTSYSCTTGEFGTFNFLEVTNRIATVSGRMGGQSANIGCVYNGRFTALNPMVP